jgi:O-antigen ligase
MRTIVFAILFALVFTLPLELIVFLPVGSICQLIGYFAIVAALIAVVGTARLRPPEIVHYFMVAFIVWAEVSVAWTADLDMTTTRNVTFLSMVGLVWLIWEFAPAISQQVYLMLAYILGAAVGAGMQIVYFLTNFGYRFSGGGLNSNDFALVQIMAMPMTIYAAKSPYIKIRWLRWLCAGYCPVAAFSVLLTGSRMGFAVMLGIGMLYFLLYSQHRLISLVIIATTAAIAGPVFYLAAPAETVERILGTGEALRGDWTLRQELREEGLRAWAKAPLAGSGAGTFQAVTGAVQREGERSHYGLVAHNAYIGILVELGMVGLGLFAALLLACLVDIWQLRPSERITWALVFVAWAVAVFALSWEAQKPTWFMVGMIAAQHSAAKRWNIAIPRAAARTTTAP